VKKTILLLALILTLSTLLSTGAMAAVHGTFRTAAESVNREWSNGDKLGFINWINFDGFFKGDDWGNFQLGVKSWKMHVYEATAAGSNDDGLIYGDGDLSGNHGGETGFEFRPGYQKNTAWGTYGGQLIFSQGRGFETVNYDSWDTIKPEVNMTYNLSNKSRIFTRALYEYAQRDKIDYVNDWAEIEAQYKYDIAGGTLGVGIFIGEGFEEENFEGLDDRDEIRGLLNYAKYFPQTKIFMNSYSEVRRWDNAAGDYANQAKLGVFINRPVSKNFIWEAEANVFHEFDVNDGFNGKAYQELFFMTALRYNFW